MIVPVAVPAYFPEGIAFAVGDSPDRGDDSALDATGDDSTEDADGPDLTADRLDDPSEPESHTLEARELASSDPAPVKRHVVKAKPKRGSSADSAPSSANAEPKDETPSDSSAQTIEDSVTVQPTTVLVFKDGHRSDVVNYAIVGDTLFDLADGRARKIRLDDLDLAATQKVNDDHGVDFKVPPAAK